MHLLLLISGKKDILEGHPDLIAKDFDIIKIDEKDLSRFGFILSKITQKKYEEVWFGMQNLRYHRFVFFIFCFLIFGKIFKGGLLDETGNKIKFSLPRFIFVNIPLFIIESLVSLFVVIYFYLKFPIKRWISTQKH
jgi:hypothetical protein